MWRDKLLRFTDEMIASIRSVQKPHEKSLVKTIHILLGEAIEARGGAWTIPETQRGKYERKSVTKKRSKQ